MIYEFFGRAGERFGDEDLGFQRELSAEFVKAEANNGSVELGFFQISFNFYDFGP